MKNHPIVEAIKKERQSETAEQTRARALRYVERQKSLVPAEDVKPLYKATTPAPLSEDADWQTGVARHRADLRATGGSPVSAWTIKACSIIEDPPLA